jgi:DNA-binding SARP family transcriptional activator
MDFRIQTLGGFRVFRGEEELPRLTEQPTRAAVLVYLGMERDVTRDVLQGAIWSDLPPERARHSLNQALYLLRREFGDDWIVSEGERLRASESLSVDAIEFERLISENATAEALALYEGEFLEGWYLRDTPEFEHWTDRVRLRLSRLHREARRSRLSELRRAGGFHEALGVAREWLRRDPLGEEVHHALIECLALSGRRADALQHFEAWERERTAEQLPIADETLALVEKIRSGEGLAAGETEASEERSELEAAARAAGPDPGDKPPEGSRTGRVLAGAAAVVAIALLLFAALGDRKPPPPTLDPDRVLVYPLENRTGDATLDPAGMLAADWITRSLARASFLEVFPTSELASAAGAPAAGDGTPEEHLARAQAAARATGCGTLVTGAYYGRESEIEFHAQVLQAPEWELMESVGPIRIDRTDPMEAVGVLGQRVLVGLAVRRDESLGGVFAESARPPSYEAYVAFADGFRMFLLGRPREAAEALMRANEIAPEFTAPLIVASLALVRGWGDFEAADSVLQIVEASQDRLPPYDRLRFELAQATVRGDHRRAYRAAREAAALVPGGTAHYASGHIALELNRPREALEVFGALDPTQPRAAGFVMYWDMLTQAHHLLGSHAQELEEARRARSHNADRIEPVWLEIRALAALGRLSEIYPLLDESQRLGWTPELNPGLVLVRAAEELQVHGDSAGAQEIIARFPAWFDSLDPQQKARPDVRLLLGRAHYLSGRFDEARPLFEQLRSAMPANPAPLRYLGTIAARTGDTEAARTFSRELDRMTGLHLLGQHTLGRAANAARLGERQQAVALLRRAVTEGVRFGTVLHSDPDLLVLADYAPFQEFMRPDA